MEERVGFVGIVMQDRSAAEGVNRIIGAYAHIIRGRMGIPDQDSGEAVIGLIVRGSNDELGALTGKLGNLPGVQVKSALTASKEKKG
ncbi:MAG: CopG family transcriptional regulator [Clostridiales bacterium]|nr:CopG family transcriptional regulator [Clostridiales bacterium]